MPREYHEPPASPKCSRRAQPLVGRPAGAGSRPKLPAALPAAGARRGFSGRLLSFFSSFESINRNIAGGARPPKSRRESSCGDFHSLPQVLLRPPDLTDPALSPASSSQPGPKFSHLRTAQATFGPWWIPPGRARLIACNPGPQDPHPCGRGGRRNSNNALRGPRNNRRGPHVPARHPSALAHSSPPGGNHRIPTARTGALRLRATSKPPEPGRKSRRRGLPSPHS